MRTVKPFCKFRGRDDVSKSFEKLSRCEVLVGLSVPEGDVLDKAPKSSR